MGSTIIKNINNRLQEDSDSESDSDNEYGEISTKRISELDKEDPKNQSFSGDLKRHNKGEKSGNFSPPPAAASTSTGNPVGRPRLSGPNVAPGTAISVNSFSMVKHAAKKASEGRKRSIAKSESESSHLSHEDSDNESILESEESDQEVVKKAKKDPPKKPEKPSDLPPPERNLKN